MNLPTMNLTILKTTFARISADTFLLAWNVASIVTFLLPLLAFTVGRLTTRYDEDGNAQNEDYYNPYENENNYDEYGNYIGPQHWWEFWKDHRNGEQNNDNNDEAGAPWWCKCVLATSSFLSIHIPFTNPTFFCLQ